MRQQNPLYGHIIRADPQDIMRRVTINERLEAPKQSVLRGGRPRESWVWSNNMYAMSKHCDDMYDETDDTHAGMIAFVAYSIVLGTRNVEEQEED